MLDFSLIKPYQFLIIAIHLLFFEHFRWLLIRNNSCVEDRGKFLQEKCANSWLATYRLQEHVAALNALLFTGAVLVELLIRCSAPGAW